MIDRLVVLGSAALIALFAAWAAPGRDDDPCEESLRRWGRRSPGCAKPTAGDRWSADHADPLAGSVREVRIEDAGDAVLWVDEQGNLGLRVPVERIVYFDGSGSPIGGRFVSERCRKSLQTAMPFPTAIVCLEDDSLRQILSP